MAEKVMRVALVLLVALLLAPGVLAHVPNARPIQQVVQRERVVEITPTGLAIEADLMQEADPLRNTIVHTLDPSQGRFRVEHREDGSVSEGLFFAEWRFTRIVEYRDVNADGRFQPASDAAVRSWRLEHYDWRPGGVRSVQVQDVRGTSALWEANLTGAPDIRLEAVVTGKEFTDEGALVRPQDVVLYIDVSGMPERNVGGLHAIEGSVRMAEGSEASAFRVENATTALLVDAELRRGLFVWGGESFLDGAEKPVDATLGEPTTQNGVTTRPFAMHLPAVEDTMHLVWVMGIEYGVTTARGAPGAGTLAAVAALAVVAAALSRSAR